MSATKQAVSEAARAISRGESAILNPTGKGGFGDNPENRHNGRWKKENSISYNYHKFLSMSEEEFNSYIPETMAQVTAYDMVKNAKANRTDIVKEITDRTEGKAPQSIDMTTNGDSLNPPTVRIIDERQNKWNSNT